MQQFEALCLSAYYAGLEKPRFLEKVFRFLGFFKGFF